MSADHWSKQSQICSDLSRLFPGNSEVWWVANLTLTITKLVWWWAPVIPAFRHKDPEFESSQHTKFLSLKKERYWEPDPSKMRRPDIGHKHIGNTMIRYNRRGSWVWCNIKHAQWMNEVIIRELGHGERALPEGKMTDMVQMLSNTHSTLRYTSMFKDGLVSTST